MPAQEHAQDLPGTVQPRAPGTDHGPAEQRWRAHRRRGKRPGPVELARLLARETAHVVAFELHLELERASAGPLGVQVLEGSRPVHTCFLGPLAAGVPQRFTVPVVDPVGSAEPRSYRVRLRPPTSVPVEWKVHRCEAVFDQPS